MADGLRAEWPSEADDATEVEKRRGNERGSAEVAMYN
jgi:hypothetical protein